MSEQVQERIVQVASNQDVLDGVAAMLSRGREFPSPEVAVLAGIGVQEYARSLIDEQQDQMWLRPPPARAGAWPEVVIGSGPHALIYAAIRSMKGVPVLMLEKNDRAGGAFACSQGPAFWLNSRNRPGPIGLPGEGKGLNVLPGCMLQPSMIGGGEYQTNDQLAWVIRANLMMLPNVQVCTGVEVASVVPLGNGSYEVTYKVATPDFGGTTFSSLIARRVVLATGLGDARAFNQPNDQPDRLLSFFEFMSMMDSPFPLQGMGRVAVIGGGDSGKTAVETLLGQGPATGFSVAGLDFVGRIDWYGARYPDQETWCANNRGRYARIGKALGTRVTPLARAEYFPSSGFESVQIGPRTYDFAVNCTGYTGYTAMTEGAEAYDFNVGNRTVAKRLDLDEEDDGLDEVYLIGPAAAIPLPASDRVLAPSLVNVPDNASSLFRYAPLTATFADVLPQVTD